MNGQGVYKWVDGKVYEGNWRNGKREGYGILTYADGRKYEGEHVEDKR